MTAESTSGAERRAWALALFRKSVIKQRKFREIDSLLEDVQDKKCLDVGADNGVISLLLRERGGEWHSGDLDPVAVSAIRELVGSNVHLLDGRAPFGDKTFDVVVIVDYLEHIRGDREFVGELDRILKPGGTLIVNVPHIKPRSWLNRFRNRIGLTDAQHGHVRPGYTVESLRDLLGGSFDVVLSRTYSGSFSEMIDILLNAGYQRIKAPPRKDSPKGNLVTHEDHRAHRLEFAVLAAVYPLLWLVSRMDGLLYRQAGYKLIVKCSRHSE